MIEKSDEMEGMWKEIVVDKCCIILAFHGGADQNNQNLYSI